MGKTYIVAEGHEFSYPADPISLAIIKKAGGRSHIRMEDSEHVKFKEVKAGEDCSDMPQESLALYIERGWVVEKTEANAGTTTTFIKDRRQGNRNE